MMTYTQRKSVKDLVRDYHIRNKKKFETIHLFDDTEDVSTEYTRETVKVALNDKFPMRKNMQDWN